MHGAERTYWLAAPAHPAPPPLLVLHGMGLDWPRMADWIVGW